MVVGAGRPVDGAGEVVGLWTPEKLAEAISQLDGNQAGVELRTVQLWFQDNDKGIGPDNISWLAKIFGCGDPDATTEWRKALFSANALFISNRREQARRQSEVSEPVGKGGARGAETVSRGLALRSEAMFHGRSSLNLPIAIWASLALLWLLTYVFGVHSITYTPVEGVEKQVGFSWSPAWVIGEPIFLPILLILVTEMLSFWKEGGRSLIDSSISKESHLASWAHKVRSFSASFWAILFICAVLIFAVQWAGVYLRPLLSDAEISMVDWITVGLVRPDAISVTEAVLMSLLGFLYSGMLYWFYFVGFLLIYAVAIDFVDLCQDRTSDDKDCPHNQIRDVGAQIISTAFKSTLAGIMIAVTLKLNAAYLISDAETIVGWLLNDLLFVLGLHEKSWGWINDAPSPFLTSFLLAFVTAFVFFVCLLQVFRAMYPSFLTPQLRRRARLVVMRMCGVVVLLTISFLLIGQFKGFSILLFVGVAVAFTSFFWRVRLNDLN